MDADRWKKADGTPHSQMWQIDMPRSCGFGGGAWIHGMKGLTMGARLTHGGTDYNGTVVCFFACQHCLSFGQTSADSSKDGITEAAKSPVSYCFSKTQFIVSGADHIRPALSTQPYVSKC
jgi:hypothetical protein